MKKLHKLLQKKHWEMMSLTEAACGIDSWVRNRVWLWVCAHFLAEPFVCLLLALCVYPITSLVTFHGSRFLRGLSLPPLTGTIGQELCPPTFTSQHPAQHPHPEAALLISADLN